jgi:hypothetical protein
MKIIACLILAEVLLLSSCGSKKNSGSNRTAKSEEISSLVQVWQKQVIKSCNASDIAAASNDSGAAGLDMALVLEKLGGSAVFTDGAGRTVQLTSLPGILGSGTSKFESEVKINGNSRRIALRTEYSGDRCSVYSGDQLLAESRIAQRAEFRVLFDSSLSGDALTLKSVDTAVNKVNFAFYMWANRLMEVSSLFADSENFPVSDIAAIMGIGSEQAASYVFSSAQSTLDSVVAEIDGSSALTSFSAYQPEIYAGSESALTELSDGREFNLKLYLAPSSFGENYQLNPNDKALLKLHYRLKFEPQNDALPNLRVSGFENAGRVERSGQLFQDCVLKRNEILQKSVPSLSLSTAPRYDKVVGSCGLLSNDSDADLFEQKELREMILSRFNFVTPSRRGYDGWEVPLRSLVMHCVHEKSQVQNCLESSSGGEMVYSIDKYFEFLKTRMPQSMELRSGQIELPASLALNWALTGQQVSDERAELIAKSISNLTPELSAALPDYLEKFEQQPLSNDEIMQFALSRDSDYKAAFMKLTDKATQAGLIGAVSSQVLRAAIVKQIVQDQFAKFEVSIDAIVGFRKAELERAPADEFGQASALADVEELALAGLWTEQTFATATKIADLARFKITCSDKKTVSKRIDCIGDREFSTAAGKMLAPEFGGRYGELAGDFVGYLEPLEKDFDSLRYDLVDAFGSDLIWSKCDLTSFERNRSELKSAMKAYFATESYRRYSKRDEIQDILDRCS